MKILFVSSSLPNSLHDLISWETFRIRSQ
ncbi:hypothetical protein FGIG_11820 [Fasciola gigantica]|uniref:Uncharacterized protein n=1 Tax=Fasciola gigantica TaxID=46835 RepID=A0A504Z261_FASGI|nr:hypothetical protein FGIG_11820 [Fasciola gigantica]